MNLLPQIQNTHLFCVFMVYGQVWYAYLGHLLTVWKAPMGPDTLEISHDSGFHTERPENPIELG